MNKKILLLAAAALLAFACGKTEYPEYEWGPQDDTTVVKTEVFFTTTTDVLELDPSVDTVVVELGRTITTEALSVPLIVKDPSGVLGVPSSAEFAAGEATTTIDIILSKMELEKAYELSISIPDEYYYTYKKTSGAVSAKTNYHLRALKQQWNDAGTCIFADFGHFTSSPVMAEDIAIQNHEGTDDYRIVAPYAALFPGQIAEANFLFTAAKNKKGEYEITIPDGMQDIWPGTSYVFYWDTGDYSSYCVIEDVYDKDEQVHTFYIDHLRVNLTNNGLYLGKGIAFVWYDCPVEFPVPEEAGE